MSGITGGGGTGQNRVLIHHQTGPSSVEQPDCDDTAGVGFNEVAMDAVKKMPLKRVDSSRFHADSTASEINKKTTGFFKRILGPVFNRDKTTESKEKYAGGDDRKTFWQKIKQGLAAMVSSFSFKRTKTKEPFAKEIPMKPLSTSEKIATLPLEQKHLIIKESIKYLKKKSASDFEGIFRLAPNGNDLEKLSKKAISISGDQNSVNTETESIFSEDSFDVHSEDSFDVHAVATLIKRSINGVLDLTKDGEDTGVRNELVEMFRYIRPSVINVDDKKVKEIKYELNVEQLKRVKDIIGSLGENKKILLQDVFKFLNEIANNSAINQMSPANLAVCISPGLFPVDSSDITEAGVVSNVNMNIIAFLIANAKEIFPDPSAVSSTPPVVEEQITSKTKIEKEDSDSEDEDGPEWHT